MALFADGAIPHSEGGNIQFTVEPVDSALCIDADPQLLPSAVMNLLHTAFRNTPSRVHVRRAHGGEFSVRNTPGRGCVLIIDAPLEAEKFEWWHPSP
jgi:signal transduction histidine kinase